MRSSVRLAVRNLGRNRARSAISLSAIAFGVISLLIAGGFIEWIFWAMREAAIQTGLGHIQVTRPGFVVAGRADPRKYLLPAAAPELAALAATPHVRAVDARLLVSGLASNGETTVPFSGEAVDPTADRIISKALPVTGRNLAADDPSGILLGPGLAAALGVKFGDVVSLLVNLPGGGISAVEGRFRGTFTTGVKAYDDNAVRMPAALGRQLLRVRGAHAWVIALDDTDNTDAVAAALRAQLPGATYDVSSWLQLSDFYRKSVALLSRQIQVVALLIGMIIILGISNTSTMNVLERTREIGTLMALGTTRRDIMRLFIVEGVVLGVVGALVGLAVGYALATLLSTIGIPMPPPPGRDTGYSAEILLRMPLIVTALTVAVTATALASAYPAWRASRLPIVDALRHNV